MKRYCSDCKKETSHSEQLIRSAADDDDAIFSANGDDVYEVTCQECGASHEEM
ncbi:hypothetical protein SAMN03080615_01628 [Amphritea atlantica]|uniref:Uncharacterized protein n=1 Tax=Amphritea atlantica TaxID=355243 RepID=A0A1H9GE76_9GAMM|nr:hypothetical protein SAMN03080615_01628 [Amphritea atlantica]